MGDDGSGTADGIDTVPAGWLPALARIAGSEDVAALLAAVAALLDAALPHDLAVLSSQYVARAFERGQPSADPTIVAGVLGLTATTVLYPLPEKPTPFSIHDRPFIAADAARREWAHGLAFAIPHRNGVGATLALYRTAAQGSFEGDGVRMVALIRPLIARAFERLLDQQQAFALNRTLLGFLTDLPVGLIMLDWDYSTVFVNREGYRQALVWRYAPDPPPRNADPRENFELSNEVYGACNEFRNRQIAAGADWALEQDGPPTITVKHPARDDLRVSITASRAADRPEEPPKFLIRFYGMTTRGEAHFEPTLDQLELLAQLTAAERSIALLVRQGLSNREIADRLHREVSTVKDHLTHIFDKLALRSRVQLARMLS